MYLLLEYCANGNLFNYLRSDRNPKLSKDQLMNIFTKVCQSVAFMHVNKMIHRDIKPENILLDDQLNPKLCDFGWSIELKKNEKRQTFCGTYEYMAPEIFESETYFSAVDVWSLGILLYELFHGRSPFVGNSIFSIYKNIIKESIVFDAGFDDDGKDLVQRILRLNPSERPTVAEMLEHPFLKKSLERLTASSSGGQADQNASARSSQLPTTNAFAKKPQKGGLGNSNVNSPLNSQSSFLGPDLSMSQSEIIMVKDTPMNSSPDLAMYDESYGKQKVSFAKKATTIKVRQVPPKSLLQSQVAEETSQKPATHSSKDLAVKNRLLNLTHNKTSISGSNLSKIFKSSKKNEVKFAVNSAFSKSKASSNKQMEALDWADKTDMFPEEIGEEGADTDSPVNRVTGQSISPAESKPELLCPASENLKKSTLFGPRSKHMSFKNSFALPANRPKISSFVVPAKKPQTAQTGVISTPMAYRKDHSTDQLKAKLSTNESTLMNRMDSTIYDSISKTKAVNQSGRTLAKIGKSIEYKDIYKQTATGLTAIQTSRRKEGSEAAGGLEDWNPPMGIEGTELSKKNLTKFMMSSFKERPATSSKKVLSTSMATGNFKKTLNNKVKSSEKLTKLSDMTEPNLYGPLTAAQRDTDEDSQPMISKKSSIQTERFKLGGLMQNNNLIYSTSISNQIQRSKRTLASKQGKSNTLLLNTSQEVEVADLASDSSAEHVIQPNGKTKVIVQNIFSEKGLKNGAVTQPAKQSFNITINQFYRKDSGGGQKPEEGKPVKVQIQHV